MPLVLLNSLCLPILGIIAIMSDRKSIIRSLFLFLFLAIGIFRFDTSTDYSAYAKAFWEIKDGVYNGYFEIGYVLLNKIFAFSDYGYWVLLALIYLFFYKSIVSVLGREKAVIGVFLLILYGFNIRIENIIRQSISMGIFLLVYPVHVRGENFKYITFIFLAALFHSSILLVFVMDIGYPLFKRISSKRKLWMITLSVLLVIGSNLLDVALQPLLGMYLDSKYMLIIDNALSKREIQPLMILRTLATFVILTYSFNNHGSSRKTYYVFLACIGHFISGQFILFERVFEYFYLFEIVVLTNWLYTKRLSGKLTFIILFLALNNIYINYNTYRWNRYKTIFTEDFLSHSFYDRILTWEKANWSTDDYYDRTKTEKLR